MSAAELSIALVQVLSSYRLQFQQNVEELSQNRIGCMNSNPLNFPRDKLKFKKVL